jgi:asparagine synthase (glutamine-hydrolysing)
VSGHLGGISPFIDEGDSSIASLDIGRVIDAKRGRGETVELDPVGLVTKTALPYLLADRTLLKGVRRTPWMPRPTEDGGWAPVDLPPHGHERPDPERFTQELKTALLNEAREYIGEARTVGILLSGGMDSRVVAGVVRALQEEADSAFTVVGLTWGREASRDVIYARRIVERFGWEWQHFPLTSETLAENIGHAARLGAEVSPLHLHAMPQIAKFEGVEVILAGSYGDSVGRAEFSGRHVTQLKSVLPRKMDRFGVLPSSTLRSVLEAVRHDASTLPHANTEQSSLRRYEIEQQKHYMRRMLQSCMQSIAFAKPIHQLFTSPNVFGRMWRLDPSARNGDWYSRLLPTLPGDLLSIPWARTGKRYDEPTGDPDHHERLNHKYGAWLRGDLRDLIIQRVKGDRIKALGLFNERGVNLALRAWSRAGTSSANSLDELFSWMASLDEFLGTYQLTPERPMTEPVLADSFRAVRGGVHAALYVAARERLRK